MDDEFGAPQLPAWAMEGRLEVAAGSDAERGDNMDTNGAAALARQLRALETRLTAQLQQLRGDELARPPDRADAAWRAPLPSMLSCRLLVGACCELYAALATTREVDPASEPAQKSGCRLLYKDALHAAVWTSSHVCCAADLQERQLAAAVPTVHSVPSELAEWDLSDLYARRLHPKSVPSKQALAIVTLLARCTNPGCRGWDAVVSSSIQKSDGVRRLCTNAIMVALTGMHSFLHPALRLHWTRRHALMRELASSITNSSLPRLVGKMIGPFKESMRRLACNALSADHASMAVLHRQKHPVALLHPSPLHMPHPGLEAACSAFANAGKALAVAGGDVAACVNAAFNATAAGPKRMQCNVGYLGKGTANVAACTPAVDVAATVFAAAYRCNFLPFWAHGSTKRLRVARLDEAQHAAIHEMNAATRLARLLPDDEQMKLNRLALAHPSAAILTVDDATALLGAEPSGDCGSRTVLQAAQAIGCAGPRNAARLLAFCRMAQIADELLIYDLGPRTALLQARALTRRLLVSERMPSATSDPISYLPLVPSHATTLLACVECRRVNSAHVMRADSRAFTEIGASGAMAAVNTTTREVTLRCAKRCSASMRSAMSLQRDMASREVEGEELNAAAVDALLDEGSDPTACTRARRDAKITLEQRGCAVPCGVENMLRIPLVGKAVRLWGEFYALCSLCGCVVRFRPCSRFGSDICCGRCDVGMLFRADAKQPAAASAAPRCRFCGKEDPQRSGVSWRCCRAPHDISGSNADKPPPLRVVHFCPLHFRNWIPACLKTMPTRVILSHIVYGAKPCYHFENDESICKQPPRRRRIRKR